MALLHNLPEPASLADLISHYPDLAALALPLADHILRGPSPLSPALRELLFAYGSTLNACSFCAGVHRAVAEALGADGTVIEALLADLEQAPIADRERPLFAYLRKLTLTPGRLTAQDADAVRAAGWSDDALHGVIAVSALHNFFNRWVDGCGVTVRSTDLHEGARQLAERGYRLAPRPAE